MKKELNELTSKKLYIFYFVASILVVWIHCNPVNWGLNIEKANFFSFVNNSIQSLSRAAVPFFFVSSGFLLYKDLTFNNLKTMIVRKIKRYAIPFITWSIICFCIIDYLRNMDYAYIPLYLVTSSFDGPLWFIEVLILLVVLSPLMLKILQNKKLSIFILVILFILAICINIPLNSNSIEATFFYPFQGYLKAAFPYYFLGAFLGRFYFDEINNEKYFSSTLAIILISVLVFFHSQYFIGAPVKLNGFEYEILIRGQGIVLWLICSNKLFKYKNHWWYHKTFFTYASHWIFVWLVSKIFMNSSSGNMAVSSFKFLLIRLECVFVITPLTIAIGELIMRIFPKFYTFLVDGKLKIMKQKNC